MNRHEFYDNLNKYKSLSHSSDYKYYNKIDLGNGKTRYFYTKAEWDAYQEGEARNKYEQQKKTIANNKAADEAKAKANQENSTVVKNEAEKKKKQQEETIRKNAEAERAQNLKKQNDSTISKQRYENNKAADEARDIENRERDFAKKKENNPQMLNANGDWRNDRGESDMAWALFTEAGGLDGDLPYYLATLVRGEREPSDSRKERCERIIDVRYNKKEAEECREFINNIVQDAEDIKDQVLADEKLKEFLDEFQKSVDEGSWNYYKAHDEMVQLVHKLFNYYSKKSKYADYYWQDSSTWKSGLVMGNMNQRSWNAVDEIMKNMIKKYKEKNNK
jgi:hypothetical protein